jgi:hypothetical protein
VRVVATALADERSNLTGFLVRFPGRIPPGVGPGTILVPNGRSNGREVQRIMLLEAPNANGIARGYCLDFHRVAARRFGYTVSTQSDPGAAIALRSCTPAVSGSCQQALWRARNFR